MFSSRINMNLREANGYTYGARSQFSFWRNAGPFAVTHGRADRCDRAGRARDDERAEADGRDARDARGADAREGLHRTVAARPASRPTTAPSATSQAVHLRPAAELLLEPGRAGVRRRRPGGAGGGEEVPRARTGSWSWRLATAARIGPALEKELGAPAEMRDPDGQPISERVECYNSD